MKRRSWFQPRLWAFLAGAVILLLPLLSACLGPPELVPVRIGVLPEPNYIALWIGEKNGWFKDEGVEVKLVALEDYTDAANALADDLVDFAPASVLSRIIHFDQLDRAKFVLFTSFSEQPAFVFKRPGLKSYRQILRETHEPYASVRQALAQLEGRTILVPPDMYSRLLVREALRYAGLGESDATIRVTDGPVTPEDFIADREADVLVTEIRWPADVSDEIQTLITARELPAECIHLKGFVAPAKWAGDHEDLVLKFMRVWYRVVEYVQGNPDDAFQTTVEAESGIYAQQTFTVDELSALWNRVEWFPLNPGEQFRVILRPEGIRYWQSRFDAAQRFAVGEGLIAEFGSPENISAADHFNRLYTDKHGAGTGSSIPPRQ